MRDNQSWKERELPRALAKFPARIQRDLERIKKPPSKMPGLDQFESLYIEGPSGSGKTIMAAFLLLEAAKIRYLNASDEKILFISTPDLFELLKRNIGYPQDDQQDLLDQFCDAEFLVLDDFGAERPTEWIMSTLYLIINRRYEGLKRTIFTSNLSLEDVAERFGDDRITSRIDRMCEVQVLAKQYTN